jgi:hypothetical protein
MIQARFRAYIARKKYRHVHLPLYRTLSTQDKRLSDLRERVIRKERELEILKGMQSSRVQEYEKQREWKAAIMIQKFVRGWQERKRMKAKLREQWERRKQSDRQKAVEKRSRRNERPYRSRDKNNDATKNSKNSKTSNDSNDEDEEDYSDIDNEDVNEDEQGLKVRLGRRRPAPPKRKGTGPHIKDKTDSDEDEATFGNPKDFINPWEGFPVATTGEGDIESARHDIVKRLQTARRTRSRQWEQAHTQISQHHPHMQGGTGASSTYWDGRDSAAHLIAGLKKVKLLLDGYYDDVDEEYWEPVAAGTVTTTSKTTRDGKQKALSQSEVAEGQTKSDRKEGKSNVKGGMPSMLAPEEPLRRYKILPYDLSMGCRSLRVSTDRYLNTLLGKTSATVIAI